MSPPNKIDLTNQRFGHLTAIRDTGKRYKGLSVWHCQCDCGNTCEVTTNHLRTGHTTSCGCAKGQREDLTGKRFGRLVVQEYIGRKNGYTLWKCACDCGNSIVTSAHSLKMGRTKSCGCLNTETRSQSAYSRFGFVDGTSLVGISDKRRLNKNNSSGVRGVTFDKKRNKWVAQITFQRKNYYLGRYDTKEEAIAARKAGEEKYYGKYRKELSKCQNQEKTGKPST